MIGLKIVLVSPAWPDLAGRTDDVLHLKAGSELSVTGLEGGMQSGKPSVCFRFDLPDGKAVLCETSLALFLTAADALRAKYGDPRS